ncbi:hypothetical protein [Sphingomonas nostoxanthinifaciens]|uniref:hypothetical protein n=1 Tax=Sphingomonas nostoxanthinifaciens TaxID=2872652 RepID=UPI001CC1CBA2|nr:hypothetical protein [Sphingomonas nostoxanthinifaciens]UAK25148.1 hypothetical protein K8P63_02785 [Sphingomonas nostoxanthinifaciens]
MVRLPALFLAAALLPTLAVAETPPGVVSLSPEQRLEAINNADGSGADAALGGGTDGRKVHGEVGMMIGTGGARGIYGVTAIPLGQNGTAVIGFESTRFNNNYWRR